MEPLGVVLCSRGLPYVTGFLGQVLSGNVARLSSPAVPGTASTERTPMQPCFVLTYLLVIIVLAVLAPGAGALTPQQIAVVVNRSSLESVQVGHHYAQHRGVPETHVIPLDLGPLRDTISRQEYEQEIAQPLRQALIQRGLAAQIRTLVTVYGMPLSVQGLQSTPQERLWLDNAHERFTQALQGLQTLATTLGVGEQSGETPPEPAKQATVWLERLQTVLNQRATQMQNEPDMSKRAQMTKEVTTLAERVGGQAALLQALQSVSVTVPPHIQDGIAKLQQQLVTIRAMLDALRATPSEVNRQHAYRITEASFGLQGLLQMAAAEVQTLQHQDSDASVDSELSLLWVDGLGYRPEGRSLNPWYYTLPLRTGLLDAEMPLLMVSRLDAPTPALAKQMVDDAIAAEQHGLNGTVYIDARGLKGVLTPWSSMAYDQNLRDLAALFRQVTPYHVVLEETDQTLHKPGEAPHVAVYVGWYRYRAYEDAFTFNPGALGYHIASGEAISVHDPQEKGWCKNALERGIAVTLGPTNEPYLDAFPLPSELFGLLLTGKYTLVEAYYLTTRYLSWRMVLFGDPLYNPWRDRPLATLAQLTLQPPMGKTVAELPVPLSERPFPDPLHVQQQWQQRQAQLLAQVDVLLAELARRQQAAETPSLAPAAPPPAPQTPSQ